MKFIKEIDLRKAANNTSLENGWVRCVRMVELRLSFCIRGDICDICTLPGFQVAFSQSPRCGISRWKCGWGMEVLQHRSILHFAVVGNLHDEEVALLMKFINERGWPMLTDDLGANPVHYALELGKSAEVMRSLLDNCTIEQLTAQDHLVNYRHE